MAKNKTKPTSVSPKTFISQIENDERRKDALELVKMMRDVTGAKPTMWGPSIIGFDRYRYTYASGHSGEAPLAGFSPRQQELVVYLAPGLDNTALMRKIGKHKTGKSCLYIKKLDDVDRGVLRDLVAASIAEIRKRYP
jgi:hypothetical protein